MGHSTPASSPQIGYDGASISGPESARKRLVNAGATAEEIVDYDVETVERVYR